MSEVTEEPIEAPRTGGVASGPGGNARFAIALSLLGRAALAAATVIVLVLLVLRIALKDWHHVVVALQALYTGAFGSPYDFGNTVNKTTPLLLTGLGVAVAFRAKLWNIGGEGQFLVGALAASAVGAYGLVKLPGDSLVNVTLAAGFVAGGIWAAFPALLKIWRNVPEVISTIMLNFLALNLLSYLVHGPMQQASHAQPATEALPASAQLPIILPHTTMHAGIVVGLVAALAVGIYLFVTPAGFNLRLVGANSAAARFAGANVSRVTFGVMVLSGALCGLAGSVELSGLVGTVYETYSPGYGFAAVAVALLGRLHPAGVVLSAFFFGALAAGAGAMERVGVSPAVSYVIQAITLFVLLFFQQVKVFKSRVLRGNRDPG
jgi:simple sugar transport system permease protein